MNIQPEYFAYTLAALAVLTIVAKFTRNKIDDVIVSALTGAVVELQDREANTKPTTATVKEVKNVRAK